MNMSSFNILWHIDAFFHFFDLKSFKYPEMEKSSIKFLVKYYQDEDFKNEIFLQNENVNWYKWIDALFYLNSFAKIKSARFIFKFGAIWIYYIGVLLPIQIHVFFWQQFWGRILIVTYAHTYSRTYVHKYRWIPNISTYFYNISLTIDGLSFHF